MNTRCLVSRRPSCSILLLLHRDAAFTGAESRLASSRLIMTIPASNRHLSNIRAIQWCSGWPFWRGGGDSGRRRVVGRENRLDEISKNLQEFYSKINHTNRRNLAPHHNHHHHHHNLNHWRCWSGNRENHLSENRGRWRAGRGGDRNEWKKNKPTSSSHAQQDEFGDIIKRIEADPYEFLFGRSNQYLRGLPRAWSPFCRSFLDIGSARETKPKTSSAERSATDHHKHPDKVSGDSNLTSSVTSAVHSQELQFDPISGRMVPRSETVDKETTNEKEGMDIPVKGFSWSENSSTEKHDLPSDKVVDATQAPSQSMGKNDIIYLEDSAHESVGEKASVVPCQKPETAPKTSNPEIRQFSDFDDDDIHQLSASDIRASFASRNSNSNNDSAESTTHNTSTDERQVNEAAKHVKGFSGNMQLLNEELTDLCARLEESFSATAATVVEPDLYRVLAYDPSTSEVVLAETTSSIHATSKVLAPSEVMLSINNPAKFLPYFARMENDGYEIVSGSGNILVFRREASSFNSVQSAPPSRISNMQMGPQVEATIAHVDESIQPIKTEPTPSPPDSTTAPRIVRRQETIYTGGPPNWSPYPPPRSSSYHNLDEEISNNTATKTESSSSSVGKTIRRVFLTGFATAGVFYAVGVVCEYFRTGGQDGLGPVGFTAFEAERRRRE